MPSDPTAEQDGASSVADEVAAVLRARSDPYAFEPIFRAYYPRILAYCRRRLDSPEDAADAASQTFAKALAGVGGFTGGAVAPWLFTIARRVVIDAVRARRPHVGLDAAWEVAEPSPGPDALAASSEERRALHAAIVRLTAEQREVVELRMAGLTGQEIADVLGLSLSAVKSSQFRAFARLRTFLGDEHIFGATR